MTSAEKCRENAQLCQRAASNTKLKPAIRDQWLELAYHWQLCADYQECIFSETTDGMSSTVH